MSGSAQGGKVEAGATGPSYLPVFGVGHQRTTFGLPHTYNNTVCYESPAQLRVDSNGVPTPDEHCRNYNNITTSDGGTMLFGQPLHWQDSVQIRCDGLTDNSLWTNTTNTISPLEVNGYKYFDGRQSNRVSPDHGPIRLEDHEHPVHFPLINVHGLPSPCYSDPSCSLQSLSPGTLSSIDPRELYHTPESVPSRSGFSTVTTSFDGSLDQTFDNAEFTSSLQWPTNQATFSELPRSENASGIQIKVEPWGMDSHWTMVGDSGSQTNHPHHDLPAYILQPQANYTTMNSMPQGVLCSLPHGLPTIPANQILYQNSSFAHDTFPQQPMVYNLGTTPEQPPNYGPTHADPTSSMSANPYVTNWYRPPHGYGRIQAPPGGLPLYNPQISTAITRKEQRQPPALSRPSPGLCTEPAAPEPCPDNPKATGPLRRNPPTAARSHTLAQQKGLKQEDLLLLHLKESGKSYKDIKELIGTETPESTLRGRFRSLTKAKEERVRKPKWTRHDIHLLRAVVTELTPPGIDPSTATTSSSADRKRRSTIPWKKVAERIRARGGSYHFGNATCRKRWDSLMKVEG